MKKILLWSLPTLMLLAPTCCTKKIVNSSLPPAPLVVHEAHLPEGWYAHDPAKLDAELDGYFELAAQEFAVPVAARNVRALIVPHAGHYYSGLCAASAYQTLVENGQKNNLIERVIILAPSHFALLHGIALPDYTVYKTPLGEIPVDHNALNTLAHCKQFRVVPEAHKPEHSLEIQLPFLQKTIESFQLVPLIVGRILGENYLEILKHLGQIIDDTTLIVVSSDFTHHGTDYDYKIFDTNIMDNIRQLDSMGLQAIFAQSFEGFSKYLHQTSATICGRDPIKLLLALLESEKIQPVTPTLCCSYTSAHLEQARQTADQIINIKKLMQPVPDAQAHRSVSYAGIVFAQKPEGPNIASDSLSGYEKKALLACARSTLENVVKPQDQQVDDHLLRPIISPGVVQPSGAFITLNTKDGNLRGCIGRITTPDPLFQTVMAMSYAAALHDTRFKPVQAGELNNLVIDISVLTPPHTVPSCQDIIIGKHGVILNKLDQAGAKTHSAVFLPQVPVEWKWDLPTTLEQLAQKASLPMDGWKENCSFEVFEDFEIKEEPHN
ncbi:AmmeMemoRadiSam system protein B [Candidatus Dependentiae bacterium]|nr:AmmeMemoRadiSam system protein B [Candidatus Dependentiae bacterium]